MRITGLYAICDNSPCPGRSHLMLARSLLAGGARILQLRMKGASSGARRAVAREILQLKLKTRFIFIINDDLELARAVGADGVHVGADDPALGACRRFLGPGKLLGYSAHSLEEAKRAETAGADYVAFGAIYPSRLKGPGHPVQGLAGLKKVLRAVEVPVVAIGGINHGNVQETLATGVSTVAAISALNAAPNVTVATRLLQVAINEYTVAALSWPIS